MSSELTPLLLLVVLLVVFWLVVLRPARTQQRTQQALQRSLEVGEDVVLSSGIFGTVTDLDDAQVGLEIAPGTVIRVARQVVVRRVEDVAPEVAGQPVDEDSERPAIFADQSPETTAAADTTPTPDTAEGLDAPAPDTARTPDTAGVAQAPEHAETTAPEIAPHEVPESELTTGSAPATEAPEGKTAAKTAGKKAEKKTAAKTAKKASAKKAGATRKTTTVGSTSTGATAAGAPATTEPLDEQSGEDRG